MHAFAPWFHIVDRATLSNQRTLLLLERIETSGSGQVADPVPRGSAFEGIDRKRRLADQITRDLQLTWLSFSRAGH